MGSRPSLAKSILAPTHSVGGLLRPRSVRELAAKVDARIDWLRFVPIDLMGKGWICSSGGLGVDISFELELAARCRCHIYGFDPVPKSIAYVSATADGNDRFTLFPVGLWSTDSTVELFVPANGDHVSHSIVNLQGTNDSITATCRSLQSLMTELGHPRIDLLKLDVEGAEYEVLKPVFAGDLSCRVLCVDFHKVTSLDDMVASVNRLRDVGYVPVHVYWTDVTFVREPDHEGAS
jgi:FkbM family methyltransferase